MDMYDFVWTCFPAREKWLNGSSTGDQGAVIAFDLGINGGNPPTAEPYSHDWLMRAGEPSSASGPWCAGVDRGPGVRSQNAVHAEHQLVDNFDTYLARYREANNQYPGSVSLYSYYSPCKSCATKLRKLAQTHKGNIALWYLYFDHPNTAGSDVTRKKSKPKQKYLSFEKHMEEMDKFTTWSMET
ncbi:MAG: hypothetical protein ACI9CO_000054 [Candidatus Azotimanducaceae bacterium]|jgi:hypothetical protein